MTIQELIDFCTQYKCSPNTHIFIKKSGKGTKVFTSSSFEYDNQKNILSINIDNYEISVDEGKNINENEEAKKEAELVKEKDLIEIKEIDEFLGECL